MRLVIRVSETVPKHSENDRFVRNCTESVGSDGNFLVVLSDYIFSQRTQRFSADAGQNDIALPHILS